MIKNFDQFLNESYKSINQKRFLPQKDTDYSFD